MRGFLLLPRQGFSSEVLRCVGAVCPIPGRRVVVNNPRTSTNVIIETLLINVKLPLGYVLNTCIDVTFSLNLRNTVLPAKLLSSSKEAKLL